MRPRFVFIARACAALFLATLCPLALAEEPAKTGDAECLIVVGPSTHPPGSHEVAAGARLLKHCLENSGNLSGLTATIVDAWPTDASRLAAVRTVVFVGDTFPPQRMPDTETILDQLSEMTSRGCGIVCIHYATGLRNEDVAADGEHPLLHWMGGYFATGCDHHQSIARIYPQATITPASPEHPISRGWKEFTLHDEPYINNYFGKNGNRPAENVTVLATSMLPPQSPRPEIVAWCVERADSGRGFGIVMPHFYRNWAVDELRTFILNGIAWTAKREIPADGVQATLPDLAAFAPEAVVPPGQK